jgi:carbamate kinase
MARTIVVALGGNALIAPGQNGSIAEQFANTRKSLDGVVELLRQGHRLILTHGNGPMVGNYLIRVEEASHLVPEIPLGVIVADTQGGIGYMIMQQLRNKLHLAGLQKEVTSVVTQVVVDPNDPSINAPTKFVGPFFAEDRVTHLITERGWQMREDRGRGYRRVVASPEPHAIVEIPAIQGLLQAGHVVIACGGGGIPVYYDENGLLEGVDAVVDKDKASALLASEVDADEFIILTGVDKVCLDFGTDNAREIDVLTQNEAARYLREGQFPAGSMGPKIEAALSYLRHGGQQVIITSIENSSRVGEKNIGTIIVREENELRYARGETD